MRIRPAGVQHVSKCLARVAFKLKTSTTSDYCGRGRSTGAKYQRMNSTDSDEQSKCNGTLDEASSISLTVLNSLTGLATICGNLFVLLAIYKLTRLQTISNYFIASLALADFVVGLVLNPIWAIKSALNIWEYQAPITLAAEYLSIHTIAATTLNLCAVSIDRYLAVVSVFRYNLVLTEQRCKMIISLIWLCAFFAPLPRLFIQDPLQLPKLWITGSILTYVIPLNVIAFCYFHIFKAARSQAKKICVTSIENERERNAAVKRAKERKTALTIAIILGLFIIFWSPTMLLSSVQMFTKDDCLKIELIRWWFWSAFLASANSAVNPWVYAIRSGDFRSAFWKLLGRNHRDLIINRSKFSRATTTGRANMDANSPPASGQN